MASQAPDENGDKKPLPETKKRTGYECDFVELPPKQLQSECPICLQILREPHLVLCCGHSFCASCIGRIEEDGKPCPLCQTPTITHVANLGLKRTLSEFRVYCPHRLRAARGCEWEGELGKLDEHLNSDPKPQCQLEGCPFSVIKCLHCKEGIRRGDIAGHQLERCPQRPYTCEYCAEYKSTFEDVAHSHWPECKRFLLPCPNDCTPSGSGIQRQHLDQHVKEECPLTVVQCELHHTGCEVMLPRKDMADHMKEDSIAHISLLTAENHHLSKRLVEKEEQMILLTRRNIDLEEEITKQAQYLNKAHQVAIDQLLTQLTQKITSESQELLEKLTQTKREVMQKVTFQSQELTRVKKELTQGAASQSQELTRVKKELTQRAAFQSQELEAKLTEVQQQAIERLQIQQQYHLQELRTEIEMQHDIPPVTIKMAGFDELKEQSTVWYSRPFYTGMGGYKMCFCVFANGHDDAAGTHISLYTYLIRGEFDSSLNWPFRGTITINLVNQLEDKEHHTHIIEYSDTTPYDSTARVTHGERSEMGWGQYHKFLPHSELGLSVANNCQYLKDDNLIFRIVSIELTDCN